MRSMRVNTKTIYSLLGAVFLVFLLGRPALAHKVYLFAWVEGDTVYCDAYFSKSRKVQGGTITVKDEKGTVLAQGETDDQGAWQFPVPGRMDLFLEVSAGTGHRGEFMIAEDELPGQAGTGETGQPGDAAKGSTGADADKSITQPAVTESPVVPPKMDVEAIRQVVADELDRKLQPLARSVALLREDQGPSLNEIIGGIGYIFGIMGLVMYFRSKKQ